MTARLEDALKNVDGVEFFSPTIEWDIFTDCPQLAKELESRHPGVAAAAREMSQALPVQTHWRFGDVGPLSRPDRHVRAFYLDLAKIFPNTSGFVAIKGSEVLASNFASIIERLQSMWSVFTWSIGGLDSDIVDDMVMMDQLERFPVTEGKPPGVHPLHDAIDEAHIGAEFQMAHLARYGELAHTPFPLFAVRWPDETRERVHELLDPLLSTKAKRIVDAELSGGLGTFVYYYPELPMRVMHIQPPHPNQTLEERHKLLDSLTDVEKAVHGWLTTTARMIALGWVPADPASLGRGNCMMAQNLVLDGGIVDLDSLREVGSFRTPGELQFALQKSLRVLAQSFAWFFVGPSAGSTRFERIFPDCYSLVWSAIREQLSGEDLPPQVAEIMRPGPIVSELKNYFARLHALSAFRPGDREEKKFSTHDNS